MTISEAMAPRPRGARLGALGAAALALLASAPVAAFDIVDHGSPWSKRRARRPHTRYIVLHTTEGAESGSLHKLSRDGEAHYLVGRNGRVYRIVAKDRIAAHAGRSMWEGHENLDEWSIGVEIYGYHDRPLRPAQKTALKELLRQLQGIYGVPDERVLTHSMVAYGSPNRWHRRRHRGRKRCAMRLAEPRLRRQLGLESRPPSDPDVNAGRLVVADRDLYAYLFPKGSRAAERRAAVIERGRRPDALVIAAGRSPWDIAKERYASFTVRYHFPDGRVFRGNAIKDWLHIPVGTRVELDAPASSPAETAPPSPSSSSAQTAGAADPPTPTPTGSSIDELRMRLDGFAVIGIDGDTPNDVAGDEARSTTTIYFFPDGLISTGAELAKGRYAFLLDRAPEGTRILVGYAYGGYVKPHRSPSQICGDRWNYPSTFYRLPDGRIVPGDLVDPDRIPQGTLVFFRG